MAVPRRFSNESVVKMNFHQCEGSKGRFNISVHMLPVKISQYVGDQLKLYLTLQCAGSGIVPPTRVWNCTGR